MDPTTLNALITAGAGLLGAAGGALAGSRVTIYRIEQLEKKVEAHNHLSDRIDAQEKECARRSAECTARFVGARRDIKEALDEHLLDCHSARKVKAGE